MAATMVMLCRPIERLLRNCTYVADTVARYSGRVRTQHTIIDTNWQFSVHGCPITCPAEFCIASSAAAKPREPGLGPFTRAGFLQQYINVDSTGLGSCCCWQQPLVV